MSEALTGFLAVFICLYVSLIVVPITHTLRASISAKSKIFCCAFLLAFPLLGAAVFHFKYKTSLLHRAKRVTPLLYFTHGNYGGRLNEQPG
jgi:hypothetical protein